MATAPKTAVSCVTAAPNWHSVDFISDVHLQVRDEVTFNAWRLYMERCSADALFILGDLFEVWTGDDGLDDPRLTFEKECIRILNATSLKRPLHFMRGNRDFLVGSKFFSQSGARELQDPCLLELAGQRVVLTHGDAYCWSDTAYMTFRKEVRSPAWQRAFLSQTLNKRLQVAKDLRNRSEALKHSQQQKYIDLDVSACHQVLAEHHADTMLHGHTHQPANLALDKGRQRLVLSDWDACSKPARLQVLRWSCEGWHRMELSAGTS